MSTKITDHKIIIENNVAINSRLHYRPVFDI